MLNFEQRLGPVFDPPVAYPAQQIPAWYRDAKLGFFIHWGLYSVPGWAVKVPPGVHLAVEESYAWHQYAEWYANTVKIVDSPCYRYHAGKFGPGFSYEDFADAWQVSITNIENLVWRLSQAGAGYVVPTTKHHDGFCLWNTTTTPFNAARRGPRHDLIALIAQKVRENGMRLGLYYSGALDWHVSDFGPIISDYDLFTKRRNDRVFADYSASQLRELIDLFQPDMLWNDIEWPDSGKGGGENDLAALFTYYQRHVTDGIINDRWGVPCHGVLTREYSEVNEIMPQYWEATRGLGRSFGYNQNEDAADEMAGSDLAWLLVDVAAKGGNLLINVGPQADGSLDPYQSKTLSDFSSWSQTYLPLLRGSQPFDYFTDNQNASVRYLRQGQDLIVFVGNPQAEELHLPSVLGSKTGNITIKDAAGKHLEIAGDTVRLGSLMDPACGPRAVRVEGVLSTS